MEPAIATPFSATPPAETPDHALLALRRARRKNRLADLDWFEAAYRVYLVAFLFGGTALWLSSLVTDAKVSDDAVADMFHYGPAVLGMLAVLSFAGGVRSGSRGGPLAIEDPDVRHVLLAPVDRRRALLRPAVQRVRATAFAGAVAGALAGQLAGRRLPGSDAAWTLSGTAFGITVTVLFIAAALIAHTLRVPRWAASLLGACLLAWQTVAIVEHIPGPGNLFGSLALWGVRQRAIDLLAPASTLALVAAGLMLLQRTSLDALARRSGLVAQLHFAVTMQDLRTVMLLRRQLSQENTRSRPWIRVPRSGRAAAVWRRGWHSLLRFPASRLLRMVVLAIGATAAELGAYKGTTALFVVGGLLLFLLGMETMEPLSQEIDQPDRLSSLPRERGEILIRHTMAPLAALVPFAALGVAYVALVERSAGAVAASAIIALPTVYVGAAGAVVSIVKDAPDVTSVAREQTMMPPEVSGLTTVIRTLIPLVVSVIGASVVIFLRAASDAGDSVVAAAVRAAVGLSIFAALLGLWVRRRDEWRQKFSKMMNEGRDATAQQRAIGVQASRSQER